MTEIQASMWTLPDAVLVLVIALAIAIAAWAARTERRA